MRTHVRSTFVLAVNGDTRYKRRALLVCVRSLPKISCEIVPPIGYDPSSAMLPDRNRDERDLSDSSHPKVLLIVSSAPRLVLMVDSAVLENKIFLFTNIIVI